MKKIIYSGAVAAAVLAGSALAAAPALASGGNAGSTSVVSLDATGAQFTCSDGSTSTCWPAPSPPSCMTAFRRPVST